MKKLLIIYIALATLITVIISISDGHLDAYNAQVCSVYGYMPDCTTPLAH